MLDFFIFFIFNRKDLGLVALFPVAESCSNPDAIAQPGFQGAMVENLHGVYF